MADPTKYAPSYSFTGFQTQNPTSPLPAPQVDNELANVAASVGEAVAAIKDIRRSDGALRNQVVTPDSLSAATRSLLTKDINPRGAWASATAYAAKDAVEVEGATYLCAAGHTSGVDFAADMASGKWLLIASPYSLSGAVFSQVFSGDGSTTVFSLSQPFQTISDLQVYVQNGTAGYELVRGVGTSPQVSLTSPTQITFASAPGSGTRNILVLAVNQTAAASAASAASSASAAASSASAASASATSASGHAGTASAQASAAAASAAAAEASKQQAASYSGDGKGNMFTATGGETTLSIRDGSGTEFSVPTGLEWSIELSRGGVIQRPGVDYVSNGTSVVSLTSAATAGEVFWWVRKGGAQSGTPSDGSVTPVKLAGVTPAADKLPYMAGAASWSLTDFTEFGRSAVGGDAGALRALMSVTPIDGVSARLSMHQWEVAATYATKTALSAHSGNTANPHSVTAAQVGAYTVAQVDTLLGAKAATSSLGSAAYVATTAFATAAQGAKADTALQSSNVGVNPGHIRPVWAGLKS